MKRRRVRWLASIGLTIVVLLLPAGVYAWGSHSSTFSIRKVELRGAHLVSTKHATALLDKQILGRNLFSVRAADVRRALRSLVFLDSVQIDRRFPSKLVVNITEHEPALYAFWRGHWYLVAASGRILNVVLREARPKDEALRDGPVGSSLELPTVPATAEPVVGSSTSDPAVRTALAILRALPASVSADLAGIRSLTSNVHLSLRSGVDVAFGSADRFRTKSLALAAVLKYYRDRHVGATYVDVSVPDRPLGKPQL